MKKPNVLLISFEGLLSPVFRSQFKPLMMKLSKEINFTLIAVERHNPGSKHLLARGKNHLEQNGIRCYPIHLILLPLKLSLITNVLLISVISSVMILLRKIDIVHIRRYDCMLTALLAKSIFKKKIIFDPRGLYIDEMVDGGQWKRSDMVYKIYRYFERKIIKAARAVIAVSRPFKEYLEKKYKTDPQKVILVPNCVDIARFHTDDIRRRAKTLTLIYIGGTSHWHMIDEMLDFYTQLSKSAKVFFRFLTYENHEFVRRKFSDKKITPGSYEIASVLPEQIPGYLNHADAGFALIRPSLAKYVCAPIKFGEYLAAGLPVIINRDIGETGEIIQKYHVGIIYDARQKEECAIKLIALLDDERIHENCRAVANKLFSLEIAVDRLRTVYNYVKQ